MKKYGKFAALIVVVIGTLVWLATAGMKENQTYYKTITELGQMGDKAYASSASASAATWRTVPSSAWAAEVAVRPGAGDNQKLKVAYTGTDPLPGHLPDGAQALADGKLGTDGVFHAAKIQAKCAPSMKPSPGSSSPDKSAPNINSGKQGI